MKPGQAEEFILIWGPVSEEGLSRLKQEGRIVLVPESRPSLLGLKYNLVLLRENGVGCVYCPDNALGSLFYEARIAKTLLFCRGSAGNEPQGICGSLYAGLLSRLHNVPVEVLEEGFFEAKGLDEDASTLGGRKFILEEAPKEYIIRQDYEPIDKEVLI